MKHILKHTLTLSFLFMSGLVMGQQSLKIAHSMQNTLTEMSIQVEKEGAYEVIILAPNGEKQSQPIKLNKFKSGELITFKINSKYWLSGIYQILVRNEQGTVVKNRQLIIDLSAQQKQQLKQGP